MVSGIFHGLIYLHKAIAGQRASVEKGKVETDEELRQRVANRMDPWWISEHDVEEAFQKAINDGKGPKTDGSRPRL